jgi:hypothetical protein
MRKSAMTEGECRRDTSYVKSSKDEGAYVMLEEFDEQLKAHGLEIIVRETSTGFAWRIDLRLTPTTWDEEGDQVFQMRDGWHYRIGGSVFGTWLDEGAALAEMQAEQRRRRARG